MCPHLTGQYIAYQFGSFYYKFKATSAQLQTFFILPIDLACRATTFLGRPNFSGGQTAACHF